MSSPTHLLWISPAPGFWPPEAPRGFSLETVPGPAEALDRLRTARVDVILATCPLTGCAPAQLLEEIQRVDSRIPVLIHDPNGTTEDAFRLGGMGAYYFFAGPLDPHELARRLEAAAEEVRSRDLASLAAKLSAEPWRNLLVGESRAILNVIEVIRLVGARRSTVLITGETGTGKELAARALHMAGPRAGQPLVVVNCSTLPEHLLEAELFGHVRGAFTGAINNRVGRFEQADGGTLFLDEIGDMPLDLQIKLLRVLQEREFQRLGSSETIRVNIRVVAASNSDLPRKIKRGKFREDLYYRLHVVPIAMPSLRERPGDIPLLVQHFMRRICGQEGVPPKVVRNETLDRLSSYWWPGNVRQLENAVEMAVALSGERETLYPGDFPIPSTAPSKPVRAATSLTIAVPDDGLDFEQIVGVFERNILEQALRKVGGNKQKAAHMLHLKRTTLAAKLRSLEARIACAR